ncbi:MAG: S8 family serine peptidase, partial [Eubacterium sp.]
QDEKAVEAVNQVMTPGYASTKGLGISLDEIPEGESFYIEMTMENEALKAIDPNVPVYFAFQGGCDNAMYGKTFQIEYKDTDGSFKKLESTQESGLGLLPARLRLSDCSWNQSTQALKQTDFLKDNGGKVTLRLKGDKTAAEAPAMFRMDAVGFGKEAVPYYYADGTSMATPMVTGIAALLGTQAGADGEPCYEAEEVIARIKGGVNRDKAEENGLMDKSVSQGTVDAAAAFDDTKVVPVLNNLTVVGNT